MLYTNIYDVNEWKDEAISMKAQGFSTRYICRSLFSNENYRNRLNAYFKREDVAEQIKKRQKEIEFAKYVDPIIFEVTETPYETWEKKGKPSLGSVVKKPTILIIADT